MVKEMIKHQTYLDTGYHAKGRIKRMRKGKSNCNGVFRRARKKLPIIQWFTDCSQRCSKQNLMRNNLFSSPNNRWKRH